MFIPNLNYVLLFVKDPAKSAAFYSRLFNLTPTEESPTFACFALPNGVMLGLWSRLTARPTVVAGGGGSEICFVQEEVDQLYFEWVKLGVPIALEPVAMDGMARTFVALDPDGHRIRVLRLEEVDNAGG